MKKTSALLALVFLGCSALIEAQTVTKATSQTATATILAIDKASRHITLKNEKGEEDTYLMGPLVQRFDELKVGDKVKMTYYESLVFQLRKPGQAVNATEDEAAFTRAKGTFPGGTIATQQKRTVLVKTVDMTTPSLTVTTDDGRIVTRLIEDKKNLANVKVGDRIDITYTEALLTSVEPAK